MMTPEPEPGELGSRSRGLPFRMVDAGNTFTTEGFTRSARSVMTDCNSSRTRMPGGSGAAPTTGMEQTETMQMNTTRSMKGDMGMRTLGFIATCPLYGGNVTTYRSGLFCLALFDSLSPRLINRAPMPGSSACEPTRITISPARMGISAAHDRRVGPRRSAAARVVSDKLS